MASEARIFLKDATGKQFSVNQVAAAIPGCDIDRVRFCIRKYKAKTVEDVMQISQNLSKSKMFYAKVKFHETKFGPLTLREMWNRHPHKKKVSIATLSERIRNKGAMHESIWGQLKRIRGKVPRDTILTCRKCGRELKARNFTPVGDKYKNCDKCMGLVGPVGGKIKKPHSPLSVVYGDHVKSEGKKYFVSECHDVKGRKGKVAAFRIDRTGSILKRTTIDLGSNWKKVISKPKPQKRRSV